MVLHAVVDHLSGVVTAQVGGRIDAQNAGIQLVGGGVVGLHVDVGGPVSTGELEDGAVVAHGHQDHLGGLGTGDDAVGLEGAVAPAVDDAQVGAVLNVLLSPVATDVAELGGGLGAQNGIDAAVQGDGDHLGHLGTSDGGLGVEAAIIFTVDDVQRGHGVDGFGVDNVLAVSEVHSGGADGHHASEHNAGQSQAENSLEVLHENSSF